MKTFILILIVIFLFLYSFRGIFRHFTGKDGCPSCGHDKKDNGCGCGCGGNCNDIHCNCNHEEKNNIIIFL